MSQKKTLRPRSRKHILDVHHLYVGHGGQFNIYSRDFCASFFIIQHEHNCCATATIQNSSIQFIYWEVSSNHVWSGFRRWVQKHYIWRILRYICHISSSTFKYVLTCVRFIFLCASVFSRLQKKMQCRLRSWIKIFLKRLFMDNIPYT